ncbi:hypothetical protein A7P92_08400 [Eikenella corrodens]|uniref:hypothetical protein n=1 Tax=Eikenella corrodens TaxID=539 RepID=UPI0007D07446|nr:hypothetical protein [Eikenella corrodens]OAM22778.1 hypothetical protein A7P92_08400 [Eikenella corrodens]
MQQNKSKIVMLYPYSGQMLAWQTAFVWGFVLWTMYVLIDTTGGWLGNGFWFEFVLVVLRVLMVGLIMILAGELLYDWWHKLTGKNFLRLDTARGILLHGRWRWGWQAQREYPLSMFAAVAAEKVQNDYRGYYGRLWLESADRRNDLVLEENLLPHKGSLHELDRIQNHIAKATGLAKRPVINTVIRTAEETAANPAQLQPLQVKTLPVWRQVVNLAAAGLWTWLAVWLLRLAADWQSGSLPKPLYFGAGLLALGLLAVAVSEVRGVFRARRGRKTPQTQTAWRQPSEIKAALAAARQAEHEPQPKLPERAAPKLADGAEFAVYSVGTLLSRLMFLLLAFGMVWIGEGVGWRLFWLVALLSIAGRLAHRWHTLRKVRYSVLGDELIVYRLHSFKWLPEKRYALSEFCGIYSRVRCNGVSVDLSEIWLAGKAGGKNVRLLETDFLLRNNRQTAEITAKQISRATGLPLLEYVGEDREGAG